MASINKIREAPKAQGLASILAIGTANPSNVVYQSDFPDYYFRVTNSEHMTILKDKFKRMCEKSMIRKRHMHLTEEILKENPTLGTYDGPSLDARQDILVTEVPKLGKEAAQKALEEWGRPKSNITHLIFSSVSGVDMPGADCQLMRLLGLEPSTKRIMLYQQGCYIGGSILRMAKDIVENNRGARVLVVSAEITLSAFRGPSESNPSSLIGPCIAGDGAAAMVIGADPEPNSEKPIFEIVSTAQKMIPDSIECIRGNLREMGLTTHLHKDVPELISDHIGECLEGAFGPLGITNWNSLFWSVHLGGAGVLNGIQAKLGLDEYRMRPTRDVNMEYGTMGGASVYFVLDEIRRRSVEGKKATTGEGFEWGVLVGYGAGLTIDTVVLRGLPL